MKVGDYVRTKYGTMGKVIKEEPFMKEILIFLDNKKGDVIYDTKDGVYKVNHKKDIIKSSPNIIDLIEVGDYVNGQKVFDKLYDELNKCWYLKLEIGEVFGKYARTYQQHIKSILTKEQFEEMEYKL